MFKLTHDPIVPPPMSVPGAGGFVSFEGKVRDRNEGRAVVRLEYEAFAPLAESEGSRLLEEAVAAYGLLEARAIHRVGMLEIGESAIWIGVAAPHRAEAFKACAHLMDAIKARVPVWKKEHYADGDSDWIGVHDAETPSIDPEIYRRQTILPEVGLAGQERLRNARVLVVGAGGLGCAALPYLAAAGVGTIGICDGDLVEPSNLHRQVLFGPADRGLAKAEVAAQSIRRMAPWTRVVVLDRRLDADTAAIVVSQFDLVIDGTDNFAAKFALNDACVAQGIPLVQASLHRFQGQLLVVDPSSDGGCLRCMWPEAPYDGCVGTCAEEGVLGVVPGVFGVLQANEAIKQILDLPGTLSDRLLLLDLQDLDQRVVIRKRRPDCPACGAGIHVDQVDVSPARAQQMGLRAIDIRESDEEGALPASVEAVKAPLSDLERLVETARQAGPCVLICAHGIRSARAARWLRGSGIEAYSLIGGVDALERASSGP